MSKRMPLNVDSQSTMSSSMMNLALYLRVSTDKQDTNTSKENQMNTINKYIEEHKIIVNKIHIYEDKYSASRKPRNSNIDDDKPFTRKGLNDLINDAKLKKFDTVMVYNHDRLTRNVQESLLLKFFFDKLKIKIIYCKPGESLDVGGKELNTFFENLLNNLSALESNMIGSRTKLGNEHNVKNGFWAGGPAPYGYKLEKVYSNKNKSILKVSYSEARIVREIFNKYIQGLSPSKIAEYIKNTYENNTDRKWTKNSIISILKNKDYTGVMVWDKKGGARNPVKHKNIIISPEHKDNIIIEKEIWEQAEKIRTLQKEQPKFFSTQFLLNGYLVCGKCGKIMRAKNNGKNKNRVYYCVKEKNKWELCIKAELIEHMVIESLGKHLTLMLSSDDNFNMFYEKYTSDFNSRKTMYEKATVELQTQISENDTYLAECESEIKNLTENLTFGEKSEYETSLNFIESLKELYSYMKINKNILLQRKNELLEKTETNIINKEVLKDFIVKKKNLLDSIKMDNTEMYKRSIRLLLYDLVDKIIYNEDKNIDIIIK